LDHGVILLSSSFQEVLGVRVVNTYIVDYKEQLEATERERRLTKNRHTKGADLLLDLLEDLVVGLGKVNSHYHATNTESICSEHEAP
jgi:diphthamide synthase (EF-2-diphthine--ammonia ligase)